MSKSLTLESILSNVSEKEKEYAWLEVTKLYINALDFVSEDDFSKKAQIHESLGYALYRAAMQSDNKQTFRNRVGEAMARYETAGRLYERSMRPKENSGMSRSKAMLAFLGYWLASSVPEKRRLLEECWTLTKQALSALESAETGYEYGKTYNELSVSVDFGFFFECDYDSRKKMVREALDCGEEAVILLTGSGDRRELATAYVRAATYLEVYGVHFLGEREREVNIRKANDYWQKAISLCEEAAMTHLISVQAGPSWDWGEGTDLAIGNFEKALKYATRCGDKFMIGCAMDFLAYHTCWRARATADPDRRLKLAESGLKYAEDAKLQYSPISFTSPSAGVIWVESPYAEHYWRLALFETSLEKKRSLLQKAARAAPEMLELARQSGVPDLEHYAQHVFSKVLVYLARVEGPPSVRKKLLEESLEHRKEAIRIIEQLNPYHYWDLGVMQGSLANIRTELLELLDDKDEKKRMLQEAVRNKEKSIELSLRWMTLYGQKTSVSLFADLAPRQYELGELLNRLHMLTNDQDHLEKAIKAFEDAVETYEKLNLSNRVAECLWKMGQAYNVLGKHLEAAQRFELASENYLKASERIPQLADLYRDYALYMRAWQEIENAGLCQDRQDYRKAKEHYDKSAELHGLTERWDYLKANYSAWARLEEAEDLSRNEQSENAAELFQQATVLFEDAKESIKGRLGKIDESEEKKMATSLVKASDVRQRYCRGRICLEEAKILDRQGDHAGSSAKYSLAAEKFCEAVLDKADDEEFRPIICLCKAWQMMTRAEAEVSSKKYLEASKLFDEAEEHSLSEKAKMLALGHSNFCKALEVGTRFEATGDRAFYSQAKKQIDVASRYYLKGGFENASEYARATHRLFDAYLYTYMAQKETNTKRRAQYYQIAEKLLRASASSYRKARHPEKSEEAERLLQSVIQERQVTVSIVELLHTPRITSTTTSFSTPTPSHEEPTGLQRFEHASVEAHLAVPVEMIVEEDVEIRLDLVNVAKYFGLLVRVEDLIPDGFKVRAPSSQYIIEDGSVDLKGKRLDPLKVESVRISVSTVEPGTYSFSPKVIYTDELGKFRTCRPEPVRMNVQTKLTFDFKTESAQRVFEYLVAAFVEDYMKRRMPLERSGYRTFMEMIKKGKVKRSSVYTAKGSRGPAICEVERRGLAEERIFQGERGRGGKIIRMRVCYEKEPVKRYIDRHA